MVTLEFPPPLTEKTIRQFWLARVKDQIDNTGYIHIHDTEKLQPGNAGQRVSEEQADRKSLIIVKLTGIDTVVGYIAFEAIKVQGNGTRTIGK